MTIDDMRNMSLTEFAKTFFGNDLTNPDGFVCVRDLVSESTGIEKTFRLRHDSGRREFIEVQKQLCGLIYKQPTEETE